MINTIFQTFAGLDSVNATSDLSNLLIYTNEITGNAAMPGVLFAFYIVVMLAGYIMGIKQGRERFPANFTVAGFATFGLAVIMSLKTGLLNPIYLVISLGLAILGVVWLYLSSE